MTEHVAGRGPAERATLSKTEAEGTFTDFQLVYAITRGGPVNSTHLMATLAFQRAIPGGQLGEGSAIAVAMIPFLVFATCFSYFALARRKWQQGEGND